MYVIDTIVMQTRLRFISDIHLEKYLRSEWLHIWGHELIDYLVPPGEDDSNTVLCLAGDIAMPQVLHVPVDCPIGTFFEQMCERFRMVIYIAGNHEFYGGSYPSSFIEMERVLREEFDCPNLHILRPGQMRLDVDNITIVGTTLWTDHDRGNPLVRLAAVQYMSDFQYIRDDDTGRLITAEDRERHHKLELDEFLGHIRAATSVDGRQVVVLTHHALTPLSTHERYKRSATDAHRNFCYYTDLTNVMIDLGPQLCVHGHTHDPFDYEIGGVRFVANPFGYPHEPRGHKPVFEVIL